MKLFLKNVPNSSQVKAEFERWRGSQQEITFWNERKIKLARQSTNARARASAITSVSCIAEEEANMLSNEDSDGPGISTSSAVADHINTDEGGRAAESSNTGTNVGITQSVQENERRLLFLKPVVVYADAY